jgi:tetratricopeptide (TPR) repeat protein
MRHTRSQFCAAALVLSMLFLGACQSTPDEEEVFDPEKQGITERVTYYKGAIAKAPQDAELYYRLGNALLDMGRNQDAYVAYQKAVRLKPDYGDAYANLGLTLRKMGNLKAATGAYARALDINPGDKSTLNNLAIVAELTEDWERAQWCYGKLHALEPDSLEYAGAYAALLYGLADYEAAVPVYKKLLNSGQEPVANAYRLGYCYFALSQWKSAIQTWEAGSKQAPENASINRGLVAAYASFGDGPAARAALERCDALAIAIESALRQQVNGMANN